MKLKKKDEEENDDSSSDSEPSVDNFNCQELNENLGAALDLKEGEANPFGRDAREFLSRIRLCIAIPNCFGKCV